MSHLNDIKQRLAEVEQREQDAVVSRVYQLLSEQQFQARFAAEKMEALCREFGLTPVQLALKILPLAACYALVPISKFYVGAIVIGASGNFYFGANQEFASVAIQQTVHAEQSAVSHAWLAGETAVVDVVVNHTPCGHCRQFMNELNTANTLQIHLPHSQNNLLHSYLPDDFGPKDLDVEHVLFDPQPHEFALQGDVLSQAAIAAAAESYAPYSHSLSGLALQAGDQIISGRYAENAAFNPSFLPLQCALNYYRLSGLSAPISRAVLAEQKGTTSQQQMAQMLLKSLLGLELEYIAL